MSAPNKSIQRQLDAIKIMKPALYDEVHEISLILVNGSEIGDSKLQWEAYQDLFNLCEDNEKTDLNHPFQWETLADFTIADDEAIKIYEKALKYAKLANLNSYIASILFVIAEKYQEKKNYPKSLNLAEEANEIAKTTNDLQLRREISEFLLQTSKSI